MIANLLETNLLQTTHFHPQTSQSKKEFLKTKNQSSFVFLIMMSDDDHHHHDDQCLKWYSAILHMACSTNSLFDDYDDHHYAQI